MSAATVLKAFRVEEPCETWAGDAVRYRYTSLPAGREQAPTGPIFGG